MTSPKRRGAAVIETPTALQTMHETTGRLDSSGSIRSTGDSTGEVLDFDSPASPESDAQGAGLQRQVASGRASQAEQWEDAAPVPARARDLDRERRDEVPPAQDSRPVANRSRGPATAPAGRTLPHSIEAEEYLLSCCMLDGAEVLAKCEAAGISPSSFYDPKHAIVFDCLASLHHRGLPTEAANVAEELKPNRQLEPIGGMPFLLQVSSRVPTTAQTGYFIEKVRELSVLRTLISEATRTVEECYRFSGDIDELVAESRERIARIEFGTGNSALLQLAPRRAGTGRTVRPAQARFSLNGTTVCTAGNIAMVTALQKAGKSAVVGSMLGAVIGGPECTGDCLGFTSDNPSGHAVLHMDTEQAPHDHELLFRTAMRRANRSESPPWLHSFGVKGIAVGELRRLLMRLLREAKKIHGGIHSLLLDGVADFTVDPNDPKDVNPFCTQLEAIGSDFDCAVVCVLHLNPAPRSRPGEQSQTKSRGHLGSQLERKCETDIRLTKDGNGVSNVYTACARHAEIREKDGQRFRFDREAGMHVSLSGSIRQEQDASKAEHLREIAEEVFGEAPELKASQLVERIKTVCKLRSDSGAEEKKTQMARVGVIEKFAGHWKLKNCENRPEPRNTPN